MIAATHYSAFDAGIVILLITLAACAFILFCTMGCANNEPEQEEDDFIS